MRSPSRRLVNGLLHDFEASMDDDFNTAAALAAVHDMVREINTSMASCMDLLLA